MTVTICCVPQTLTINTWQLTAVQLPQGNENELHGQGHLQGGFTGQ